MRIKSVEYVDGYRLKLLFNDKKMKIVDLTDIVKKGGYYFEPLQDMEFFKQVSLDDDEYPLSIRWPNDADLCPDVLYEMGMEIKRKPRIPHRRKSAKISSKLTRRKLTTKPRSS